MRTNLMQPIGLGEVIHLTRSPSIPNKNLQEPVFITDKKLVPNVSDFDLYRKSDVDDSLQSGSPYLEYATTTEDISIGGIDACSPLIASIGSGASKVNVYSVFANSETNAPTIRASSSGIKVVHIDKTNKFNYESNIAWSVVSNGGKFFAYAFNKTEVQTPYCRTSADGITWTSEPITGSYPKSFGISSSARWHYNTIPSGHGIVPKNIPSSDIFSVGANFFLFNSGSLHKSSNGLAWTDVTTSIFGNTFKSPEGFYVGYNSNSAFLVTVYGIKYTTDSGDTWSASNAFTVPTTYGFLENKNSSAKYIAKNSSPDNLFYVTTNTGKDWVQITPNINADMVMYRGSSIVLLQKGTAICRTSTNDGSTFSDTSFPNTFSYPIRTSVSTPNAFYVKDFDHKIFKSTDGTTWTYIGTTIVSDSVMGFGISQNSLTDIIFSNDPTNKYPYTIIYNNGANITSAKVGESCASIVCPGIDSSTVAFGCNSINKYGVMTSVSDLSSPQFMKFSDTKIPQTSVGMFPYIRIG